MALVETLIYNTIMEDSQPLMSAKPISIEVCQFIRFLSIYKRGKAALFIHWTKDIALPLRWLREGYLYYVWQIIRSLNGGFHLANFNSTSVYHTFASSLRSNPRTAIPSRNQRWKSSNMGFSYATKTKDKFYEMSCYQRSQMLRLSQPKRKNTKY